jgi:hypothetical protein
VLAYFHRSVVWLVSLFSIAIADPLRVPLWPDQAPNGDGTSSPATANLMIPADDAQVLAGISPLNWICTPHAIHTPVCGASVRLAFMETKRVVLNLDTSRMNFASPNRFPILAWSVNNGPLQTHQLAADETSLTLSESVANPVINLFIKGMSPFEDRFRGDVPNNAVTLTGFTVDPKCSIIAAPAALLWRNLGDSILSGDAAAKPPNKVAHPTTAGPPPTTPALATAICSPITTATPDPASPLADTLGPAAETIPKPPISSINSPAPAPASPMENSNPAPTLSSSTSAKTEPRRRKP